MRGAHSQRPKIGPNRLQLPVKPLKSTCRFNIIAYSSNFVMLWWFMARLNCNETDKANHKKTPKAIVLGLHKLCCWCQGLIITSHFPFLTIFPYPSYPIFSYSPYPKILPNPYSLSLHSLLNRNPKTLPYQNPQNPTLSNPQTVLYIANKNLST